MHGAAVQDSTPYAVEIEVMKEMHWSPTDLRDAPADMVDVIIERMAAERHWMHEKRKLDEAKRQAASRK